ncbi:MAG: hypothetical protein K2X28_09115 [Alphaproteobacteria bacterium]|nr:hypothetical protein [Alphaproteobacteria bacterium]
MKKMVFLLPLMSFLTSCTPSLTRDQELAIYRSRVLDYDMMKREVSEEESALQRRKTETLEKNWIEKDKARIKQNELNQKWEKKAR